VTETHALIDIPNRMLEAALVEESSAARTA
jgi:hypothetical protein